MLRITDIRPGYKPDINFEISPMVTISQHEYERLRAAAEKADAVLKLVIEKDREFRREVARL